MCSTEPTERPSATDAEDGPVPNVADPGANRHMSAEEIAAAYGDVADRIARLEPIEQLFAGRYRRRQFGDASGRVLDVACGTGTNFEYLDEAAEVVGVDISPAMLEHARASLDDVAVPASVRRMDAESLAFDDDSFDTVVSAFSTCTFPDPVAALREMSRVCKPDGRILLLEHGRSSVGPIAWYQDWRADSHYEKVGCRWNQEPLSLVRTAGLPVAAARTSFFGIVTEIEATPVRK